MDCDSESVTTYFVNCQATTRHLWRLFETKLVRKLEPHLIKTMSLHRLDDV